MFLIEHDGSEANTRMAREFASMLESDFGYSAEQEIGEETGLLLTKMEDDGSLVRVASFSSVPSAERIRMYLTFLE